MTAVATKAGAKRARPMTRADRRQQLMRIARKLVAEEGVGALTMTALSERANVAKPVVYTHFANRQQVAIALLDEHFEQSVAFVQKRVAAATRLDDYVVQLIDASFDFEGSSDAPIQRITNGFSGDEAVNKAFLEHQEAQRRHWESLLTLSGVPADTLPVAADALSGMVNNTVYTFALRPGNESARATLAAMVLHSIRALLPSGAAEPQFDGPLEAMREALVSAWSAP